ncbi:MAG: ATP-binding cassette domain-containing protein [Planctomycetota bacterium]|nr:ATP-binding cassette domain-containing protein [Planctomycetota bacterium]
MALLTIKDLSIRYRGPALLDEVSCQIDAGQRIGLLGRNGTGKTTLMKLMSGEVEPDTGTIHLESGNRLAMLSQDVPDGISGTIADVVRLGSDGAGEPEWQMDNQVQQVLSRMDLEPDRGFTSLSTGMKRRVLLAQALVRKPDLLLLDEPTNHLDIAAIEWLEQFLLRWSGTLLFVTHDREFLRRVADRIIEIDRGKLYDWSCDYGTFLKRKEQALAAEEKQNALFDKRLAEEEAWIRQGIKARRTRNEGRVRALEAMRRERRERREKSGTAKLKLTDAQRSGSRVIEATDLHFAYDGNPILRGFSADVMRGDKIGIIGPNGVGKSTLIKILLGQLPPDEGRVRLGVNLQIAYFDQLREQLDPEQTIYQNVGEGYDHIQIGEQKIHLIGYLQQFLFTPERARTQVKFLSGGERNRILLAKLFAKPANLIVLDEPTNDLDAETLEVLEERLVEFAGTVLLVSHDRAFLNNVVSHSFVFEAAVDGHMNLKEYDGGYDDWLRQREPVAGRESTGKRKEKHVKEKPSQSASQPPTTPDRPRKLKYKEKQELDRLPGQIETLESSIQAIHDEMVQPDFFKQDGTLIAARQQELKRLENELETAFARWEELDELES